MSVHPTAEGSGIGTAPPHVSEAFFREVNDRIVELGQRFGLREEVLELICECGDTGCTERVSVPAAEYEGLRRSPGRHLVVVGHEHACRVVTRGRGYAVVDA